MSKPLRKPIEQRCSFERFARIPIRELLFLLDDAMEHIVRHASCTRCEMTHELDTLIDRCMVFLAQIDDLVS